MDSLWPWLALAAAGALHGLNPLGWVFAACGARPGGRARVQRALVAILLGHAAFAAVVAAGVPVALQALWSFAMGTTHGAGAMLAPLLELCGSGGPARGTVLVALAAVAIHMAGMLATTAAMAVGARHALAATRRWLSGKIQIELTNTGLRDIFYRYAKNLPGDQPNAALHGRGPGEAGR